MIPRPSLFRARFLLGWGMLLAYWAALPGMLPGMIAAAAAFRGGHEVTISASHGGWDVVLSHDAGDVAGHADHRTGEDQALEDDPQHGADHVICISAPASHAVSASALSTPDVGGMDKLQEKCAAPEFRVYPLPVYLDSVAARPPPGKPAWLVCLRTTVLIV